MGGNLIRENMEEFTSAIFKHSAKIEGKVTVNNGYYWYDEHDTKKIIYVFLEHQFTDTNRYYYYDFSEKAIRSFCVDNAVFKDKMTKVSDIDTIKVYDIQLKKEIMTIARRYASLIKMLGQTLQ